MEPTLLLAAVGLFVAVLVIKSITGLLVRFALFVAIALLVFQDRYGPDVLGWLDAGRATQLVGVAGASLVATKVAELLMFKRTRWRWILTPLTGIGVTILAARVVLP